MVVLEEELVVVMVVALGRRRNRRWGQRVIGISHMWALMSGSGRRRQSRIRILKLGIGRCGILGSHDEPGMQ